MTDDWTTNGFATRAIHAGQDPDAATRAEVPPIHPVSGHARQDAGGRRGGYEHSRTGSPARVALEAALAAVEGGARAFAFTSGLAAQDALLRAVLRPGGHVVVPSGVSDGTHRMVADVFGPWGVEHTTVDQTDLDALAEAVEPGRTTVVWAETPSSPLLAITDIAAVAAVARGAGAVLVVDNTFATPYLQRPIELGADVVVHSTTRYIGGHGDVVGGALVVAEGAQLPVGLEDPAAGASLADALAFHQDSSGAVAGPSDAWLTLRGLRTLALRMDRHCASALTVARYLAGHSAVTEVAYPGLPAHPGHETAAGQMSGFGGMVAFRVADVEKAAQVCGRTRVFTFAASLGGVESLIEHPARTVHASLGGAAAKVPDDLLRLSVGLEDVADLVADLGQALA